MRTMPNTTFHARWLLGPGLALGILAAASASTQDCFDETDLQLVNGNIHTMDAEFSVVSAVRVANGRIVNVGESAPGSTSTSS